MAIPVSSACFVGPFTRAPAEASPHTNTRRARLHVTAHRAPEIPAWKLSPWSALFTLSMYILVLILLIVLVSEAVLLLGYSYFTDLAYNTWCSITGNDDVKKQRKLKKQILELKAELGRTSSQDEFAKWAKIRRKLDSAVAELEKMNTTIGSKRASFDIKVKSLLWTITNLSQFVLVAWYRKTPVFYLPKGWFPGWIERVLSLPFAPRGSVSVTIWFMTCRRLVNNVIGLARDFLEKDPPYGAAAKTPVSASSASTQPLRSNPLAEQNVRKDL